MPAYSAKDKALATKLVSLYPENTAKGFPSHMGIIALFDPVYGAPRAVSGQSLTLIHPPHYEDVQCQSGVSHIYEG